MSRVAARCAFLKDCKQSELARRFEADICLHQSQRFRWFAVYEEVKQHDSRHDETHDDAQPNARELIKSPLSNNAFAGLQSSGST